MCCVCVLIKLLCGDMCVRVHAYAHDSVRAWVHASACARVYVCICMFVVCVCLGVCIRVYVRVCGCVRACVGLDCQY